mgnify:CR=1 FL=1
MHFKNSSISFFVGIEDTYPGRVFPEDTLPFEYAPGQFVEPGKSNYFPTVCFTMINKIAKLSADLRKEGLPVSIRSTFSASEVYLELGDMDRDLLRTALRAIYVKDKYDIPKFNKIFEEIFKKEMYVIIETHNETGAWMEGFLKVANAMLAQGVI